MIDVITTCEVFNSFNSFLYKEEKIKHLTDNELKELICSYYENELSIGELRKKYQLVGVKGDLHSIFPVVLIDKYCRFCDITLKVKWKKRSHSVVHEILCSKCEREDSYSINVKYLSHLSLRDFLIMHSILISCFDAHSKLILGIDDKVELIFPTKDYGEEVIKYLVDHNRLSIKKGLNEYIDKENYLSNQFSLLINSAQENMNDIFNLLDSSLWERLIEQFDEFEKIALWIELNVEECVRYIIYKVGLLKIDIGSIDLQRSRFRYLLQHFSVLQIWRIIDEAFVKVINTNLCVEGRIFSNALAITIEEISNKAIVRNIKIVNRQKPIELSSCLMSLILYNDILYLGDLAYREKPNVALLKKPPY